MQSQPWQFYGKRYPQCDKFSENCADIRAKGVRVVTDEEYVAVLRRLGTPEQAAEVMDAAREMMDERKRLKEMRMSRRVFFATGAAVLGIVIGITNLANWLWDLFIGLKGG